jgi:5-methylcytosine-specific restriction endonuclease McrA
VTNKPKKFSFNRFNGKKFKRKQPSARSKGYDAEWERYRWRFLHHNPTCYACGQKATVVDHLLAVKCNTRDLFWKVNNYLPLCSSCHGHVTQKFDRFQEPLTIEKLRWITEKREDLGIKTKVKIVPFKKGSGLGK